MASRACVQILIQPEELVNLSEPTACFRTAIDDFKSEQELITHRMDHEMCSPRLETSPFACLERHTEVVNPLKIEFIRINTYKSSSYLTGNILRLRCRAQPVNAVWGNSRWLL
jgi:hypothetical protein